MPYLTVILCKRMRYKYSLLRHKLHTIYLVLQLLNYNLFF